MMLRVRNEKSGKRFKIAMRVCRLEMKQEAANSEWRMRKPANSESRIANWGLKRLALVLLFTLFATSYSLFAPFLLLAQARTTVSDTIHGPDGSLPSGKIVITAKSTFTAADGSVVFSGAVATATVTDGTFSVSLIPNADSTPSGTSYSAIYKLAGVPYREETWVVPSSASPVNLAAVRSAALSGPSQVVANSQLPPVISARQFLQLPSASDGTAGAFPNFGTLYIRDVPIIDDTDSAGWHYSYTGDPWVFEDGGKYYLYFYGESNAGIFASGYATSDNLIDWTESGSNPVFTPGSGYDSDYAAKPSIVKIGSTYYAYVEAQDGSNVRSIGCFTASSPGGPWTDKGQAIAPGSEPGGYTTVSLEAPTVYKNGSTYYLYYSGQLAGPDYRWPIFYATSTDGIHWTRLGVAISPGSAGTWDAGGLASGRIIRVGNDYVMGANGMSATSGSVNEEGASGGIGLFYSTDLVNWTEYSRDPLIPADNWTSGGIFGGNWKPYRCQLIDAQGVIWMIFNMNGTYWAGNRPNEAEERIYVARFGSPFPSGNMTVDGSTTFTSTGVGIGKPISFAPRIGTTTIYQLGVTNGPAATNLGQGFIVYGDGTQPKFITESDTTSGATWTFSMRTDDTLQVFFNPDGIDTSWKEYFLLDKEGDFISLPVNFLALPACASAIEGATRAVNDSTVDTWGAAVAGGGTDHVLAYCDGTSWKVAGK